MRGEGERVVRRKEKVAGGKERSNECRRTEREGGLFIGHTSDGERASESQRGRACTYFMEQDFMTV